MPHATNNIPLTIPHDVRSRLQRLYVADAGVFLSVVTLDPVIRAALEVHGYDAETIAAGQALAATAGETVVKHPEGLGVRDEVDDKLFAAAEAVRDDFAGFHEVGRASFPAAADREGLGVAEDVPEDFDGFFAAAQHAYHQAGKAPYAEKMDKRGYTSARLAKLMEALEPLGGSPADGTSTPENLAAHNEAQTRLSNFMREIKGVIRGALRDKPALLSKLQLVKEKVKPELREDVGENPRQ